MELETLINALPVLYEACQDIRNFADCEHCPLNDACLEATSVIDAAEGITKREWDSFLKFSDDVHDYMHYDDEADWADYMRKMEAEDRMMEGDEYYD